ncbi:undecaprenyl-phosphate alpha-N-acetylglucosaminyl 1-phosphate transferase [Fulvitalea axinellae]|uniref:Undecaprenyl-phosphate alpha-N-acetylglucosaminyl 1-phosphate transferase n=1 Tax=Fulvitalea axinellae TaxID=1182444 RepID=A0AAU9CC74_9BACT|nr:undecaprenyl-phosphate alpha-N-acetylglucosaminyl 1-phosphate transferase [Fulvitalea axinellae]
MESVIYDPEFQEVVRLVLVGGLSFVLSYVSIPVILKVSEMKSLHAQPNDRSAHSTAVPNLGGVAIFIAVTLSMLLFGTDAKVNNYVMASLVILFFIGIKDDILVIDPLKKLIAQILATFILVYFTDIRITSFFGLFGLYAVPEPVSYLVTTLTVVVIVNAYNLIDGVDGLAATLAIVMSLFCGVWFYVVGDSNSALLSISVSFALVSFLRFNFSDKNKIFMGDTGSLITGFLLAFQLTRFIQLNDMVTDYRFHNAPIIGFVLFMIPLFDLLRVFIYRLSKRMSPFSADKNHVHHFLLQLGLLHRQITITLAIFQLVTIVILSMIIETVSINASLVFIVTLFVLYYAIVNTNSMNTKGSRTRRWVWRGRKVLRTFQKP